MKGKDVVHSSGKDDWGTPLWLFDWWNEDFKFGLDAAADSENALCNCYFNEHDDALKQSWKGYGNVFVNPPYSKNKQFLKKICDELDGTFYIVALLPSRTSNNWWHDYVMRKASEIWFIRNRLTFVGAKSGAPFPSCGVIFKDRNPLHNPHIYSLEKPKNVQQNASRTNYSSENRS